MASVIDVWAQPALRGEGRLRVPEADHLFRRSGSEAMLTRNIPPEVMIDLMDEAGIDVALLSAWCRPEGWIYSNDDVAVYVQRFPERFKGIASVNLFDPVGAVQEIRRAVRDLGFVGVRIVPWLWGLPPNAPFYFPVYVACVELGVPFCTQVGHTGPLKPSEPGRPIPYLEEVALTFPQLKIVAGHVGYPWTAEMLGLAWKFDNVYIDTSAHSPRYYPQELVHFLATYGRGKVMFGTNWPQLSFARCRTEVDKLDLEAPIKREFLGATAARVFALEDKGGAQ